MRVLCAYRPNSDHERSVMELNAELMRRYNVELELISMDTRQGAEFAKLYDLVQYPSVVALDNDGRMQQVWNDGQLPLMNEITYYLHS